MAAVCERLSMLGIQTTGRFKSACAAPGVAALKMHAGKDDLRPGIARGQPTIRSAQAHASPARCPAK